MDTMLDAAVALGWSDQGIALLQAAVDHDQAAPLAEAQAKEFSECLIAEATAARQLSEVAEANRLRCLLTQEEARLPELKAKAAASRSEATETLLGGKNPSAAESAAATAEAAIGVLTDRIARLRKEAEEAQRKAKSAMQWHLEAAWKELCEQVDRKRWDLLEKMRVANEPMLLEILAHDIAVTSLYDRYTGYIPAEVLRLLEGVTSGSR
jgi:hypothetical protein